MERRTPPFSFPPSFLAEALWGMCEEPEGDEESFHGYWVNWELMGLNGLGPIMVRVHLTVTNTSS